MHTGVLIVDIQFQDFIDSKCIPLIMLIEVVFMSLLQTTLLLFFMNITFSIILCENELITQSSFMKIIIF